jgi:hypothetical protein
VERDAAHIQHPVPESERAGGGTLAEPLDIDNPSCMKPGPRCLFDPRRLHQIAQLGVGLQPEEAFARIAAALAEAYPGHINTRPDWVFNVAGGAMGQMTFLHGSLREYLIFFGTCNSGGGHSGRYGSEVFDFVFRGKMRCEYEGRFAPEVHTQGDPVPREGPRHGRRLRAGRRSAADVGRRGAPETPRGQVTILW